MPHAQQHSSEIQAVTIQRPLVLTSSSEPLGSQTTGLPALSTIFAAITGVFTWLWTASPQAVLLSSQQMAQFLLCSSEGLSTGDEFSLNQAQQIPVNILNIKRSSKLHWRPRGGMAI